MSVRTTMGASCGRCKVTNTAPTIQARVHCVANSLRRRSTQHLHSLTHTRRLEHLKPMFGMCRSCTFLGCYLIVAWRILLSADAEESTPDRLK